MARDGRIPAPERRFRMTRVPSQLEPRSDDAASLAPSNRRILIVDDNQAIHEDFRKILRAPAVRGELDAIEAQLFGKDPAAAPPPPASPGLDYELESAYQGEEALEMVTAALAAGRPYALAFVDIRMPPGWDGIVTIRHLWEVDPELHVVICTAHTDYSWQNIVQSLGRGDHCLILRKPFDSTEIRQMALTLTTRWQLVRQARVKQERLQELVEIRTEQLRQRTAELEEREHRYRAIVEDQTELICRYSPDGLLTFVNEAYCRYFGQRREELIGRPFIMSQIDDDDLMRVQCVVDGLGPENTLGTFECRVRMADGTLRWMQWTDRYLVDTQGRVIEYQAVGRDITERKAAETKLRDSEERFRKCFELPLVGFAITAPDRRWMQVNDKLCETFGYSRNELLTRTFDELTHPEDRRWSLEQFQAVLEGRSEGYSLDKRFIHKDGRVVYTATSVRAVRSDSGEVDYLIALHEDITDRKMAEKALNDLVAGTAAVTGQAFFPAVVQHLAKALGVRYAAVLELHNPESRRASARLHGLALWDGDSLVTLPEHPLEGTAAADVLAEAMVLHQHSVPDRYPNDPLFADKDLGGYLGVALHDGDGRPVGVMCVMDDGPLTDPQRAQSILNVFASRSSSELQRQRAEAALRESQERYALAAAGANDGLWDWDLKTDEVYFSPRWHMMLGFKEGQIPNRLHAWLDRVHPDDISDLIAELQGHLSDRTSHFEHEYRIRHRDGTFRWMLTRGMAVTDSRGTPYRMAGSQTDISHRKAVEQQLRHDASHDKLTGLPNRLLFVDRLTRCIERAHRDPNYQFAVLFLDVDRFKVINDSLGHMSGDKVLVEIAARLSHCLRKGDALVRDAADTTVARLGGDEFTILLENLRDIADAVRVAERIQTELSRPFVIGSRDFSTSVSVGIASSATGYKQAADILRDADTAMYHAKDDGGAGWRIFDIHMHARAMRRLEMESDLRRGLERGELQPWYQPIIALSGPHTGRIVALEALIRWRKADGTIVFPANFISLVEETGMVVPIGREVLRTACRQVHQWATALPEGDPLTISVNISQRQLVDPGFVDDVRNVLKDSGIDPGRVILEITESVMVNAEASTSVLHRLCDLGVQLYVDDFGTGYSALSYLPTFPIHGIKVGPPFVDNLDTAHNFSAVLRSIIELGHNLGYRIIAEGVEQQDQLDQLLRFRADMCQGHFFGKPATAELIQDQILRRRSFAQYITAPADA